jgi:uncharacterized protein YqjF (DUF2071 family)
MTFIHWRFDPSVVQSHLPPGVRVDTFDGDAWASLAGRGQ